MTKKKMSFLLNTSQDIVTKAANSTMAMHRIWLGLPNTQYLGDFLEISQSAEGKTWSSTSVKHARTHFSARVLETAFQKIFALKKVLLLLFMLFLELRSQILRIFSANIYN